MTVITLHAFACRTAALWLLTVNSVSVCQGACGLEAEEAMLEQAFSRAVARLCPGDPCPPVDEMQAPQTPSPVKYGPATELSIWENTIKEQCAVS